MDGPSGPHQGPPTRHPQGNPLGGTEKKPYTLKDSAPNPKVPAGTLGGPALAVLIAWVFKGQGVDVPEDVALAMAGVIGLAIGYFCPGRTN